jgi:hypothetical protein
MVLEIQSPNGMVCALQWLHRLMPQIAGEGVGTGTSKELDLKPGSKGMGGPCQACSFYNNTISRTTNG